MHLKLVVGIHCQPCCLFVLSAGVGQHGIIFFGTVDMAVSKPDPSLERRLGRSMRFHSLGSTDVSGGEYLWFNPASAVDQAEERLPETTTANRLARAGEWSKHAHALVALQPKAHTKKRRDTASGFHSLTVKRSPQNLINIKLSRALKKKSGQS